MSKQLYEEALADVKKLKEVAEDNAKKALIEAVTPRIRDLIENQLMNEAGMGGEEDPVDDGLLTDEESDNVGPDDFSSMGAAALDATGGEDVSGAISLPDEEGKVTLDLSQLTAQPAGEEVELSKESKSPFGSLVEKINSGAISPRVLESKIAQLAGKVVRFKTLNPIVKNSNGFKRMLGEVKGNLETLYGGIHESVLGKNNKNNFESKLEAIYRDVNQLMEPNMKNNRRRINEADITLKLTGVPDEIDLESLGVELADEGGEDEGEEAEVGDEGGDELDLGGAEGEDEGEEAEGGDEGGDELDLGGDEGEDEGGDENKQESQQYVEIDEGMLRRELGRMKSLRESRENNMVVEIDENQLRREIKRMRALREAKEGLLGDDAQKWGHGPGKVSDDFEDDDLGDPFLDIDLSEGQEVQEEADDQMDEADDMDEAQEMDEADDQMDEAEGMGEMYELDEEEMDQARDKPEYGGSDREDSRKRGRSPGMKQEQQVQEIRRRLVREARLQLEAKKKARAAKKQQKENQKKQQKAQHEAQQAQKKKQSQQAQKKKQEARKCQSKAKQMSEAYAFFARKFNESVRRTKRLQTVLAEVRRQEATNNGASSRLAESSNKLRNELAETNLFNAKLLYSNKLLQNESLTRRQKAEVIQRLDEASNEREVKLVYESLVKALSGASRQLSEVAERRVLGSSSQATRPASTPMNESVELDRWAKLAGLK